VATGEVERGGKAGCSRGQAGRRRWGSEVGRLREGRDHAALVLFAAARHFYTRSHLSI
jgi:hypothetical protein